VSREKKKPDLGVLVLGNRQGVVADEGNKWRPPATSTVTLKRNDSKKSPIARKGGDLDR